MDTRRLPLTIAVCGTSLVQRDGAWYTHHSFGRVVELLAERVTMVHYHGPEVEDAADDRDYRLPPERITVHPWFPRRNTLHAVRRPLRLVRDYAKMVGTGDAVFLRGSHPLIWVAHWLARLRGRPVVHWLVGNPVAVMRAQDRGYGRWLSQAGLRFAQFEQRMMRVGIAVSRARVLANGAEVARLYRGPRTRTVVSTSIRDNDFRERADTCDGPGIRLLFVGFIRPEKGIEHLIRALPLIRSHKPIEVALVGSWGQFGTERDRLQRIIDELGFTDRVHWEGYAPFGEALFSQIDRSDILVLPSLSEGTPRVLVEARARSVPVVSTTVGGIPTSVRDGHDGLLVPCRDPAALAHAISRIIADGDLRRSLIANGLQRARGLTVDRFVDLVMDAWEK